MSYATNADIEQQMGSAAVVQLTDDAGTGAAVAARVTEARVSAEAQVDSYLARRYAVPVEVSAEPQVAAILRCVTVDLAEYRLHARRPPVPVDVAARRAAALEWLQRVAEGRLALPSLGELPAGASEGPAAMISGSPRVWGREEAGDL